MDSVQPVLARSCLAFAIASLAVGCSGVGQMPTPAVPGWPLHPQIPKRITLDLYVANQGGSTVTIYHVGTGTPDRTLRNGISGPSWLTFGEGYLYVANYSADTVTAYAAEATTASFTITDKISKPLRVRIAKSGDAYVANASSVTVYKPKGNKLLQTITKGIEGPDALAFDSSGDVYVANAPATGASSVTVYDSTGKLQRTITAFVSQPSALAFDSSGDLYVANKDKNNVTIYAPGSSEPYEQITNKISAPTALAFDSHGHLYVANKASVTVYDSGYLTLTISDGVSSPQGLAFGGFSHSLYVANLNGGSSGKGSVTVYDPGSSTLARTITKGINEPVDIGFGPYILKQR